MVMDTRVTKNCVNPDDSLQCCKKCAVLFGAAADRQRQTCGKRGEGIEGQKNKGRQVNECKK